MHSFSGKRFVTKVSEFDVLLDEYYTNDGGLTRVQGNIWGIWDKQEKKWVHGRLGIIVEDTNRIVMLDLANTLNEEGYYDDYKAG